MNQNDDKAIFGLMVGWGTTGSTDTFRRSVVDYIATIRQEERRAAFRDAAKLATAMAAGETFETGRQKALNIAAALEAAANETKGEDGDDG